MLQNKYKQCSFWENSPKSCKNHFANNFLWLKLLREGIRKTWLLGDMSLSGGWVGGAVYPLQLKRVDFLKTKCNTYSAFPENLFIKQLFCIVTTSLSKGSKYLLKKAEKSRNLSFLSPKWTSLEGGGVRASGTLKSGFFSTPSLIFFDVEFLKRGNERARMDYLPPSLT